jgi:hypothetical protein
MMAADALKRLRPFKSVGLVARWWEGGRLSSHGWIREMAIFWWEWAQEESPHVLFQIKGLCKQKSVRLFNSFCDLKIFN